RDYRLECTVSSEQALERLELIVNGVVSQRFEPQNAKTSAGSYETKISTGFKLQTTSWLAWRWFEKRPGDRFRFAATWPWHFGVAGKPLLPRREEAQWLVARVKEEIARSQNIAPESLIDDYRRALTIYEKIAATAQ